MLVCHCRQFLFEMYRSESYMLKLLTMTRCPVLLLTLTPMMREVPLYISAEVT